MRKTLFILIMLFAVLSLFAAFNPEYSDYLFYTLEDFDADSSYLEEAYASASDDSERSQILWRQSRNSLSQGDLLDENDKDGRFAMYEESEKYAKASLEAKENPDAYHWLSSALGRWGQTKGVLESLSRADEMRGYELEAIDGMGYDHTDAWYVLGILYNQLPGWPISFGNDNWAISYMRRSLDTQIPGRGLFLTLYQELSNQLYDRNWDSGKREKEIDKMKSSYDKSDVLSEKMKYYEGAEGSSRIPFYSSVPLSDMSDRQEAAMLLMYADAVFKTKADPLPSEIEKHEEIVARLAEIT